MFSPEYLEDEYLTWNDVDRVIDHLLLQFNTEYEGLVMITRGGLIPGGILCEAMDIKNIHTAGVHFTDTPRENIAWPTFMQFPVDTLVTGRQLLVVDDIWARGTNMVTVKSRLEGAGAKVETAVLHFRPKSNQFPDTGPDYYGAITNRRIIYPWNASQRFSTDYLPGYPTSPMQLG